MLALIAAVSLALPQLQLEAPQIPQLPPIRREPQVTYLDRSDAVLGVRGGRYAPPADLSKLPAYLPAAFVAIEDRRFYEHSGFDVAGIARAIITDIGQGRATQGASTITQQLARNLFLNADKTVERKGQELIYAVELEQAYTKKQILGLYLSRVYFGSGAYGIEAAAQRYFNKPAARLTLREAATLAGVVKSPTYYDPADEPDHAAERARLVLDAMVETGAITQAEREKALKGTLKVYKHAPTEPAQYFLDWLDPQTHALVNQNSQDIVVETTLDLPTEAAAGEAVRANLAAHARQQIGQAAVVSLDGGGRVRALVGGADYASSGYDRAIEAHRQAGSSWKPFVYLTAMESGLTPDSLAVDEPVTIDGWSPRDFEPEFLGQITLEKALAQSVNTIAARLADQLGRPLVAATAHRLGIASPINTEPAMALGTTLVTPLEMAQAYDTFSNGGNRVAAYGIERIRAGGRVLYQHPAPGAAPVIANPALGEMHRMMRTVIASGTGVKAAIPGYDLAGKTGTTSDFKDAWFCGFTGGLTTVVWMGRDDNTPMRGVTGGSAPAELWRSVMRVAMKRLPVRSIPPGPPAPPPPVPPPA
ncbi:MAG: transglycosylase domain-containing protein, partial [Caulobacterales bacterium]